MWIIAILGLGCRALPRTGGLAVDPDHVPPPWNRYEFERAEMALPFRIVLYAENAVVATNAAEAAFSRIHQLNGILSDYDPESELSRLSATAGGGRRVRVGRDLARVLRRSQEIAKASDGAFDVTVGPLVQLWRRARRQRELPAEARLAVARRAVGWQGIELHRGGREVQLITPGMRLDLGGIAKGYALDEAHKVLRHHRIKSALVSGGGDLRVSDPPPGRVGWLIKIPGLDVGEEPGAEEVLLKNASLCTSGDLFQHVEIGGVRYSHIVDPKTGYGLTDHSLVTVIGRDAMTTDGLSKAASVGGPVQGLAAIRKFSGVEARIVRMPGGRVEVAETAGWKSRGRVRTYFGREMRSRMD